MKKLIQYSIIAILCVGCFDTNYITNPKFIDETYMGRESASTKIVDISSTTVTDETGSVVIASNKLKVTLDVTPGAMYTLQLVNIKGEMVDNHGFTAGGSTVEKTLDYSKVTNGSYDLTLMDTNGNMTKVPVIIKH